MPCFKPFEFKFLCYKELNGFLCNTVDCITIKSITTGKGVASCHSLLFKALNIAYLGTVLTPLPMFLPNFNIMLGEEN